MRGTLATALLLAASSQTAAEFNQIDPQQVSHHVGTTSDKVKNKSSSRRFLRGSREQRADLALTTADESRTIRNAMTSAVHGITDPSGAIGVSRRAVREILDLNAFPEEVVRSRFDLNFPPSETSALLSEASNIPPRNHAFTSTASDPAVPRSRTSNQRTAKTQASLVMGRKVMTSKPLVKNQIKKTTASKGTYSGRKARNELLTPVVDKVYPLYLEHQMTKPPGFGPTKEETKAMLTLYIEAAVAPLRVSQMHSNYFRSIKALDLHILEEKLGTTLMSSLRSLMALHLSPEMLQEISRPFVWHASLARWRAMYRDFFEFFMVNSDKITASFHDVKFNSEETNATPRNQLFATLCEEMNDRTKTRRNGKLKEEVDDVLSKYGLEEELVAAVHKIIEEFVKKEHPIIPSRRQPGKQRTDLSPYDVPNPESGKKRFYVIESIDHAREKRPRSS